MFFNQKAKNFFSLTVIFITVLGFNFDAIFVSGASSNKAQLASSQAKIDQEIGEIDNQVSNITRHFEEVGTRKDTLQEEIDSLEYEIVNTDRLILQINDLLRKLDTQIDVNENKIEELNKEAKGLLKSIQKQNQVSPIQSILTSENLGQVAGRVFSLYNTQSKVQTITNEIELNNDQLKANLSNQNEAKKQLESSRYFLEAAKADKNNLINEYAGKEEEYAAEVKRLKDLQAELDAEKDRLEAEWRAKQLEEEQARQRTEQQQRQQQQNSTGNNGPTTGNSGSNPTGSGPLGCWFEDMRSPQVNNGFFGVPVASGSYRITQNFGCPNRLGGSHDGIDLGAYPIGSKPSILAAGPGIIHQKGSYNVYGYGHWVMIKHILPSGERVYSLYAHLNSASPLAVGSSVAKGQVIGTMGSSGLSTGVHLHFMFYSDTVESNGLGCQYGGSKCYRPDRYIKF